MKILITSYWAPGVGGLWTYVNGLKQGMEEHGHQVDVLTQTFDERENYWLNGEPVLMKQQVTERIRQQLQADYEHRSLPVDDLILNWEVERYGFEEAVASIGLDAYDLIHAQEIISARAIARTKPDRLPLITTVHGVWPYEAILHGYVSHQATPRYRYLVLQDHVGAESSDRVILPTRWLQRIIVDEFQVSAGHTTVIPYGLSIEAFQQRLASGTTIERPADKQVIAFPSRLSREKGHAVLLEALAEVYRVRQDFVCWLIGDGYLREELEKKCADLRLQQVVHFLGTRHDVPALIAAADFNVHPSLQDNQPFVVMEAQLAGKALAVSGAGGIPEMVEHGKTGLISPVGEVISLAENILRLLGDQSLCRELGRNGQRFGLDSWPMEKMIERTLAIYEDALREKRASVPLTSTSWTSTDRGEPNASCRRMIPDPVFDQLIVAQGIEQSPEWNLPLGHYETTWEWWDDLPDHEKNNGVHFYREIYKKVRNHYARAKGISGKWPHHTLQKSPRAYVAGMKKGRVYGTDGAVITPNHKILLDVSPEWGNAQQAHLIGKQATLPPMQRLCETVAVLACAGGEQYDHWLFDTLPRLELVKKSGVKVDRYILPPIRHAYQHDTLERLGLTNVPILEVTSDLHVEVEQLIIPSLPRASKWATEFVRREFLLKQNVQKVAGYERIMLHRFGTENNSVQNEQDVHRFLANYGFVVVDMEHLSFEQQVQIFYSADVIVSLHGPDVANLAFCQKGTKIIELFSSHVVDPRYWIISNHLNLDYYYLLPNREQNSEQHTNRQIDLQRFGQLLNLAGIEARGHIS